MDAAERRRIQNRDAQRRFRSKQSASDGTVIFLRSVATSTSSFVDRNDVIGKRSQQQAPWTTNAQGKPGDSSTSNGHRQNSTKNDSRPPFSLLQLYSDHNSTTADDSGNIQDPIVAMSLPLQRGSLHSYFGDAQSHWPNHLNRLDLNIGDLNMPSSTSHVDYEMPWLNAFPVDKDDVTGDLRGHGIEHLAQLQQFSDARNLHRLQQPTTSQPAYGTPPETPKLNNPPRNTTNSGQVSESSDYSANDDEPEAFQTALHIAAIAGHDAMIDMLLGNGRLAVDVRDSDGNTALHAAVANRKLVVVLRLLSHGASPNAENAAGWTPLHIAVQMGSVDVVGALVTHGGDVSKKAPSRNVDPMI